MLATIDRQRSELSRFLSPQVAALVSSDDGEALLAGHRRAITAMFCDLRNFTAFSEAAEPEEVLGFLRAYHGLMGQLIVEHAGTLEHFAGDGFMTFFNDPVLQPDHATRAIALAVAMRERFADLSTEWRKRGYILEESASGWRPASQRSGVESASRADTTTAPSGEVMDPGGTPEQRRQGW